MSGQGAPLFARDDAGVWREVDPETLAPGDVVRVHFEAHTIEATFEGPADQPGVYRLTVRPRPVEFPAPLRYIEGPAL